MRRAVSAPTETLLPVAYQVMYRGARAIRLTPRIRSSQLVAVSAASRVAFPKRPSRLSNSTMRSPARARDVMRLRNSSSSFV